MDSAWVFSRYLNDVPEYMSHDQPVKKSKKLEVEVVMCCNRCVEKVEEAVTGMAGVAGCTIDRWKDRVSIEERPSGGPDHEKLVRKLKKATHDKKVEILESNSEPDTTSSSTTTTTTVEYRNPYTGPLYNHLVPWPNPPAFMTNPYYLHHPVGCPICLGNPGAVCANCGRGNELGAMFP